MISIRFSRFGCPRAEHEFPQTGSELSHYETLSSHHYHCGSRRIWRLVVWNPPGVSATHRFASG
jgi:hypothetical protein